MKADRTEKWRCERWYGTFHIWGAWKPVEKIQQRYNTRTGEDVGEEYVVYFQQRVCEACGFIDQRRIE